MKVRVELRRPVVTGTPLSGRRRPVVQDRLRGVLVLPGGHRVALPPKTVPFTSHGEIGEFVRDAANRIREHVSNTELVDLLAAQLWSQAEGYLMTPEARAVKAAREQALLQHVRELELFSDSTK